MVKQQILCIFNFVFNCNKSIKIGIDFFYNFVSIFNMYKCMCIKDLYLFDKLVDLKVMI